MGQKERDLDILVLALIEETVFEHFVVIPKHRQVAI